MHTYCATSQPKPGGIFRAELGWVLFSYDDSMSDDWIPKRAWVLFKESLEKRDVITATTEWLEELLLDADLVDVEIKTSSSQ